MSCWKIPWQLVDSHYCFGLGWAPGAEELVSQAVAQDPVPWAVEGGDRGWRAVMCPGTRECQGDVSAGLPSCFTLTAEGG